MSSSGDQPPVDPSAEAADKQTRAPLVLWPGGRIPTLECEVAKATEDGYMENAYTTYISAFLSSVTLHRLLLTTASASDAAAPDEGLLEQTSVVHPALFGLQPQHEEEEPGAWAAAAAAAIPWLAQGTSNPSVGGVPPPHVPCGLGTLQEVLKHVLHHPLPGSEVRPAAAISRSLLNARALMSGRVGESAAAAPSGPSPAPPETRLHAGAVLLLFHSHQAVRLWARGALLRLVREAFVATPAERKSRALWCLALTVLAALKHLERLPLYLCVPGTRATNTGLVAQLADAFRSVYVVLAALDASLGAARRADDEAGRTPPGLPSPICVALLGGSILNYWVFRLLANLADTSSTIAAAVEAGRGGEEPGEREDPKSEIGDGDGKDRLVQRRRRAAVQEFVRQLLEAARREECLQPAGLWNDAKKAMAKVIIHGLIDNARGQLRSREEGVWRQQRMSWLWQLAYFLEPPTVHNSNSSTETGGNGHVSSAAAQNETCGGGGCAPWLVKLLITNMATQLRFADAERVALTAPPPSSTSSSSSSSRGVGGSSSGSPQRHSADDETLERAVFALYLTLDTMSVAAPALLACRALHSALREKEQLVMRLVFGGVVRQRMVCGARLLAILLRVDLLVFTTATTAAAAGPAHPSGCLQRAWEHYPVLIHQTVARHAPEALLLALAEVVCVLGESPRVFAWLWDGVDSGPAPLSAAVRASADRLRETLSQDSAVISKRLFGPDGLGGGGGGEPSGGGGGGDVLTYSTASRLITSGSGLPRLAHLLSLAEDARLTGLAEALARTFLPSFSAMTHKMYDSDAALWVLRRVVFREPALGGANFLAFDSPRVDNVVRQRASRWLRVLARCSWSTLSLHAPGEYSRCLVTAWWLTALAAEVAPLTEASLRALLVDGVVARLPTDPSADSSGTASDADAALWGGAAFFQVRARLLLALLRRWAEYPPEALTAALLHVSAAVLPQQQQQQHRDAFCALRAAVQRQLVPVVQGLPPACEATLRQYGAPWLVEAAAKARASVDECIERQNRAFAQYEYEQGEQEKAAERRREEDAEAARAAAAMRASNLAASSSLHAQLGLKRSAAEAALDRGEPFDLTAIFNNSEQQQQRERDGGWVVRTDAAPKPRTETSNAGTNLLPPLVLSTTAGAPSTSAAAKGFTRRPDPPPSPALQQAMRRAALINQQALQRVSHLENVRGLQEAMQYIAGSTNLVVRPPLTTDVIGRGRRCLAEEVPVLPEIFAADGTALSTSGLMEVGRLYANSFAPHIALELRHEIVHKFDEYAEKCANSGAGYVPFTEAAGAEDRGGRGRGGGARGGGGWRARGGRGAPQFSRQAVEANPNLACCAALHQCRLHRFVLQDALPVVGVGAAHGCSDDPDRFTFDVMVHGGGVALPFCATERSTAPGARASISSSLSEGDVVLVLLPLTTLLVNWVRHRQEAAAREAGSSSSSNSGGADDITSERAVAQLRELTDSVPRVWRQMGCYPQVCFVHRMTPHARTATLCAYPATADPAGGSARTLASRVSFLHAMQQCFNRPTSVLFVRRVSTLNQATTLIQALHSLHRTPFARTVYDPRTLAADSAAFYRVVQQLYAEPAAFAAMRAQLLLQETLNDWQVRAVAAVLFAVNRRWERDAGAAVVPGGAGCSGMATASEAVQERSRALAAVADPRMLIIEGPPGTGKTQTIAALVLNLLQHVPRSAGAGRVLLCAPSNCAVDEALLRVWRLRAALAAAAATHSRTGSSALGGRRPSSDLLKGDMVRVGVRERVDHEVLDLSPPVYLEDVVARNAKGTFTSDATAVIAGAAVVFSTLGSLSQIRRLNLDFDVVVVDEASQGTEPEALLALMMARKKCVLVGDSKQLQPTVLCAQAAARGLRRSLLVRLLRNGMQSFLLRTQYRMHPDIVAFPNEYFYHSLLDTAPTVLRRTREPLRGSVGAALGPSLPRFAFIDVARARMEHSQTSSLFNVAEAEALVRCMRQLRTALGMTPEEFGPRAGIITFYRSQCRTLARCLAPEEARSGLQIATVDSFQGREKDIIFISCVRTVSESELAEALRAAETRRAEAEAAAAAAATVHAAAQQKGQEPDGAADVVDVDEEDEEEEDEAENAEMIDAGLGGENENENEEEEVGEGEGRDNANGGRGILGDGGKAATADSNGNSSTPTTAAAGAAASTATVRKVLGFLSDWHRVNVALTRARELCLVFGQGAAVEAAARLAEAGASGHHSQSQSQPERLSQGGTTLSSTKAEVLRALRQADEDPFALFHMVQHARGRRTARAARHSEALSVSERQLDSDAARGAAQSLLLLGVADDRPSAIDVDDDDNLGRLSGALSTDSLRHAPHRQLSEAEAPRPSSETAYAAYATFQQDFSLMKELARNKARLGGS